jgi:ubiquinone biosynthesis protein COQ9
MNQKQLSKSDPARDLRDRLLDCALEEAAFTGWNDACLSRARLASGLSDGERAIMDCPPETKIRAKATLAVRARLEAMAPHKESLRRAAVFLAMPHNVPDAAQIGWRAADRAWRAMNDPSTDFNYYSKRMILTGVHAATLAFWLQDDSDDSAPTWAFLDRRIENVMGIEKIKARIGAVVEKLPDPLGVLTLLRYGRQPRP